MNVLEAGRVLAQAEGRFELLPPSVEGASIRIKYTGNDPEEEGRIAEALLVVAGALGAEMKSMETDDVHVSAERKTAEPYPSEGTE